MKTLLDTIGNTPLITLRHPGSGSVRLLAKLEGQNPGGSIKDRVAKHMVLRARDRGDLRPGMRILEATSGNMGIGLAMVGVCLGHGVTIVMSAGMSRERKSMLRALGAELVLTDPALGTRGAIRQAHALRAANPGRYWFADQFNNPDNPAAHECGLAVELLEQARTLGGIDVLVAGMGTGGTLMGLARRFADGSPHTRIIGVVPPGGYGIQGLQHPRQDFAGDILDQGVIHETVQISTEEAFETARDAARRHGLFLGMSSGAALRAAYHVADRMDAGTVAAILPDRGEKYLSTRLFTAEPADRLAIPKHEKTAQRMHG